MPKQSLQLHMDAVTINNDFDDINGKIITRLLRDQFHR